MGSSDQSGGSSFSPSGLTGTQEVQKIRIATTRMVRLKSGIEKDLAAFILILHFEHGYFFMLFWLKFDCIVRYKIRATCKLIITI